MCFVKHKSFQRKMKNLLLRSQIQKFRGRKKNLRLKFQMCLRNLEVRQRNYLRSLLPKEDLPGVEKQYKKLRSIKLLPKLSKKA